MMTRNSGLVLAAAALCIAFAPPAWAQDSLWESYKSRFMTADGRIMDYYQEKGSHSEGQGFAMLLAVANRDERAFALLWDWTRSNLNGQIEGLLAWSWGKRPGGDWGVIDFNSATDGDTLVAYALLKAAHAWNNEGYRKAGRAMVETLRRRLSVQRDGRLFLLPGYYGFGRGEALRLNPSYLVFPAYRLFAAEDDRRFWDQVYAGGLWLVSESLYGAWRLPAEWVVLEKGAVRLDSAKSVTHHYEAPRVALYLAAAGEASRMPKGEAALLAFYEAAGYLPAWVDLERDSVSLDSASAGVYAVYSRAAAAMGSKRAAERLAKEARAKLEKEGEENYYSFSLFLLATGVALE